MENSAHSRFVADGMTRNCVDPWTYVEIKVDGELSLCCVRNSIGNLGSVPLAQLLHGNEARALRAALLNGNLDGTCRDCGLRGAIPIAEFQEKVRTMLAAVAAPPDFSADDYNAANPDVRDAAIDAAAHFLEWGRLEGRELRSAADQFRPLLGLP